MLDSIDFYYFSPTGGTKKVGETLARFMASRVNYYDFSDKKLYLQDRTNSGYSIIALPVFGGRIPSFVVEKLKQINTESKRLITIVVYGTRAYEDALLELNNVAEVLGFKIIASGAFVAQHSMAPEIGTGRPDKNDVDDIKNFAKNILEKLNKDVCDKLVVSGNYPYKPDFRAPTIPITLPSCVLCKKCVGACPTSAISVAENNLSTDAEKCTLCMACVSACSISARILPPPLREKISEMLSKFRDFRRENETFI